MVDAFTTANATTASNTGSTTGTTIASAGDGILTDGGYINGYGSDTNTEVKPVAGNTTGTNAGASTGTTGTNTNTNPATPTDPTNPSSPNYTNSFDQQDDAANAAQAEQDALIDAYLNSVSTPATDINIAGATDTQNAAINTDPECGRAEHRRQQRGYRY